VVGSRFRWSSIPVPGSYYSCIVYVYVPSLRWMWFWILTGWGPNLLATSMVPSTSVSLVVAVIVGSAFVCSGRIVVGYWLHRWRLTLGPELLLFDTNTLLSFTVTDWISRAPLKFNTWCRVPLSCLCTFLPLLRWMSFGLPAVLDGSKSTLCTSMVPSTSVSLVVTLIVTGMSSFVVACVFVGYWCIVWNLLS
jgi:hypothetical protein